MDKDDKWSCASCVTLQVLYMFGFENPPFNLPEIDRRIARIPGEPATSGGYTLNL
jgi:hypothetical protein